MSSSSQSSLEVSPPGSGYLDPDDFDQVFKYRGVLQILSMRDQQSLDPRVCDEWVLFTHIDEKTFAREILNSPHITIQRSWNSYDKIQHLLLARIPALAAHEVAGRTFEQVLLTSLMSTGLERGLQLAGAATRYREDGDKQPDGQYQPHRLPRGRSRDWPTVVVEVSLADTASKLMPDVRYWLRQSQGVVQVVFTIWVNRRAPEVVIEKWENEPDGLRPQRMQSTVIWKEADDSVEICGDPLMLGFEKLFLRPPKNPKEGNIHFEAEGLRFLAICAWQSQSFYPEEYLDEEEVKGTKAAQ